MTNVTMSIVIGCAVGILIAQIANLLTLIRIAVALEKMRIQVLLRGDL